MADALQAQGDVAQPKRRPQKAATQMSEREVQRRRRRAAAARLHGHPEPKNNRIPAAAGGHFAGSGEQPGSPPCDGAVDASRTGTPSQPVQ